LGYLRSINPENHAMIIRKAIGFSAVAVLMALGSPASAQVPGATNLSPATVATFLTDPGQILATYPNGGSGLTLRVRDLLTTDKNALNALAGLLKSSSSVQQTAILDGLAQAAGLYLKVDPDFASVTIPKTVADLGDKDISKRYASAAGDSGTSSTGGGGGGGGGGGQTTAGNTATGGSNGGAPAPGSTSTPNNSQSLFSGGTAGSASFSQSSRTTF
jgi:hypothetical protein